MKGLKNIIILIFTLFYGSLSAQVDTLYIKSPTIPDFTASVRRHTKILVQATDLQGNPRSLESEGFEAICLQHELDHLDGILAVDRALDRNSFCTREEWLRQGRLPAGPSIPLTHL